MPLIRILLFSAFLIVCNLSYAQKQIYVVESEHDRIDSRRITNGEFDANFKSSPLKNPNLGFSPSTFWLMVEYDSLTLFDHVLSINTPSLDRVELFYQKNNEWQRQVIGHSFNPRQRELPDITLSFPLQGLSANKLYIKANSRGTVSLPIQLLRSNEYHSQVRTRNLLLGMFFGLMAVMVVYNFLLYIYLREKLYLYYVGATFFGLLTSVVLNGYGYLHFWPQNEHLDQHIYITFAGLSMAFSSRFTANYLNLQKGRATENYFLWGISGLSLLLALLSVFYDATQVLVFAQILVVIAFPSYLVFGVRSVLRGDKAARFYVLAWVPYVLGLLLVTLRGAGLAPEHVFTAYGIEIGGGLEAMLLSLGLGYRIKVLRLTVANQKLEKEQLKSSMLEERKTFLEKEVKLRTEELELSNATKDKFFSIIAHDLRSPMVGLQGVGQKLDYFIRKNKQEKLLELGGQIDQSIDHLNHLLNNLLNWASVETKGIPFNPQKLQLDQLVLENIDLYKSLADTKEISIVNEVKVIIVYADVNTVSTIIRNLLSNAIKFTKVGGEVVLSTSTSSGMAKIYVKDEGPGIGGEQRKNLFARKVMTEKGSKGEKGFGLGLSLCKEFAELNQGEIEVESVVDAGSKFSFSLPMSV